MLVRRSQLPLSHLLGTLIAVFFERLPESVELSPESLRLRLRTQRLIGPPVRYTVEQARSWRSADIDEVAAKALADATVPGVLCGVLRVQADESWDGDPKALSGERAWRVFLDCDSFWVGLTKWTMESFSFKEALAPPLKEEIHILGTVLGWLRAPGRSGKG